MSYILDLQALELSNTQGSCVSCVSVAITLNAR
jgi:hypothetical protein